MQTFTTAVMGTGANTGDGNAIRTGGLKIAADLTELYADVTANTAIAAEFANSYRCAINVAVSTGSNIITFSSAFTAATYLLQIIDPLGVVTTLDANDADGFTVTAAGNGTISYIANFVK